MLAKGASPNSIARRLDRSDASIQRIPAETGGIPPPERRRCGRVPALAERKEISLDISAGYSIQSIHSVTGARANRTSRIEVAQLQYLSAR
jgi:IS30 family transposase